MSAEAARIISSIKSTNRQDDNIWLGSVTSTAPLTLQLDDISYPVSEGILLNKDMDTLSTGDNVLVICINKACHIILCKVVST